MNIDQLKRTLLNLNSVYNLIDKITDETLDREVEDTLLDVSVAIMIIVCRSNCSANDLIYDKQTSPIMNRAMQEIDRQGLDFSQVYNHISKNA